MRRYAYFVMAVLIMTVVPARRVFVQRIFAQVESSPTQVSVIIGSYNCENFFDDKDDPYTLDEATLPKSESQLEELAKVMWAANADFLGVVEVESGGALYHFVHKRLKGMGYSSVYVNHRDWGWGINNGAITRLPVYSTTLYRFNDLTLTGNKRHWRFARDPVCFDLRPAKGVDVQVFVVHLKSKHRSKDDPKSNHWRLAEATMLRKIVADKLVGNPNALIVMCGDFNATPDSATMRELLRPGNKGQPPVLIDLMANLPADQRITYLKKPYRSTIDYILASPAMAKCYVPGSAKVVVVPNEIEGSDHAPVLAKFAIPLPVSPQLVR